MDENQIAILTQEIRDEQHISSCESDETIQSYIRDGEYDINKIAGAKIDYSKDLKARRLLKNFVLYARYQRLAEFKELYGGEYSGLQIEYYKPSNV